jgi:hypothetical protein
MIGAGLASRARGPDNGWASAGAAGAGGRIGDGTWFAGVGKRTLRAIRVPPGGTGTKATGGGGTGWTGTDPIGSGGITGWGLAS